MSQFFSVLSSVVFVLVPITYFRQVLKGVSVPNPATWFIWLVTLTLNAFTYFSVVNGNIWKLLLPYTILFGVIIVFSYSLFKGKFAKLKQIDIVCFSLAVGVGILWKTTNNATVANLTLQLIFIISFLPVVVGLLRQTLREGPLPWYISAVSYLCLIAAILLDWRGNWVELAYPFANGIVGNGSVAIISHIQNNRLKKRVSA